MIKLFISSLKGSDWQNWKACWLKLRGMLDQFLSLLWWESLDDGFKLLWLIESVFSPPKLLNHIIFEKFFDVNLVWLLAKCFVEVFNYLSWFHAGNSFDFVGWLGVVNQENENVLELSILLLSKRTWVRFKEKISGVFSKGSWDPVVIFSTVNSLEFGFQKCSERSQNLLNKYVCFNSHWILRGLNRWNLLLTLITLTKLVGGIFWGWFALIGVIS